MYITQMKSALLGYILITFFCFSCRKDLPFSTDIARTICGDSSAFFCLFPNPVQDSVSIVLTSPVNGNTEIVFYDQTGEELIQLLDTTLAAGKHIFEFDISFIPTGIFFCKVEVSNYVNMLKVLKQ